jgi:small-conductance mechanosensitive channel
MHSTLIARLMGPVLLVMGLGMALGLWMSPDVFNGVMKDFMGNLAIIWLVGVLTLVAGIAIINVHNVWESDWRVIITILGWLAILRGVTNLMFPGKVQELGNRMVESHAACLLSTLALIVLGVILTAKGYEAECQKYCGAKPARSAVPARAAKPARKTRRRRRR